MWVILFELVYFPNIIMQNSWERVFEERRRVSYVAFPPTIHYSLIPRLSRFFILSSVALFEGSVIFE